MKKILPIVLGIVLLTLLMTRFPITNALGQGAGPAVPPKGVIVAYYPGPTSNGEAPAGWALCDGKNGTPNLQGLFLVGVPNFSNITDVGKQVGSATHTHTFKGVTGNGREFHDAWEVTNNRSDTPQGNGLDHKHRFSGTTNPGSSIPPSMQILYIIKL